MTKHGTQESRFSGPLEQAESPQTLTARVITPADEPRVHGYDVERDLARYYGFTEQILLYLTGELPSEQAARAFDVALMFLAPVSVAHASTHAAVLARLCGATTSGMIGVAAIGLAEQASFLLTAHEELLQWMQSGETGIPERYRAESAAEHAATDRLIAALEPTGLSVPALSHGPTRSAALLMILTACGLRRREQIEAVIVLARLTSSLSEAFAERATNFRGYPVNLPLFVYEEPV
jgi:hypothetical protein